jgi:uncharacterized membrane protein
MKRLHCGFAAWVLVVGLAGPAQAQYVYTTIDVPGATDTFGSGVNDVGQIVGCYRDAGGTYHGFLLDVDGSYTPIDVPGATRTEAYGINSPGQIVGEYVDAGGRQGFLLDVDGSYTTIDFPGADYTAATKEPDAREALMLVRVPGDRRMSASRKNSSVPWAWCAPRLRARDLLNLQSGMETVSSRGRPASRRRAASACWSPAQFTRMTSRSGRENSGLLCCRVARSSGRSHQGMMIESSGIAGAYMCA